MGLIGADRAPSRGVFIFFASQAFGVMGERAWRKITGKRVSGLLGNLWVIFVIVVGGQISSESSVDHLVFGFGHLTYSMYFIKPTDGPEVALWVVLYCLLK